MRRTWIVGLVAGLVACGAVRAEVKTGEEAPAFAARGADGKDYTSAGLKGKVVVLEWINPGCPYVKKHYDAGNLQALQKKYTGKGVVWLTVSTGKGSQDPAHWAKHSDDKGAAPTTVLLDGDGAVGRAFGAKTTPHMFVVGQDGKLAYQGALDDKNTTDKEDLASARNYVAAAVDALLDGKAVETGSTKPYGCGVKY